MSLSEADQSLERFLLLPKGWDSYGASQVSPDAVQAVRTMAVVPTSQGGVNVEWNAQGHGVEVEFGPDGQVVGVLWETPSGRIRSWTPEGDGDDIPGGGEDG